MVLLVVKVEVAELPFWCHRGATAAKLLGLGRQGRTKGGVGSGKPRQRGDIQVVLF